jgi:rhodanese-related sulfurtransferase
LVSRRAEWPADKDATIVIHAGTDHRSTIAMPILWSYGYTDVRSLRGGLRAWTDAGYPVVAAEAP